MDHKKVYAGSEVMVLAVRNLLEEHNIAYIIRDDIEAGRSAGYGTLGKAVHVFVEEQDVERVEALLKANNLEE
ncbi:putative signal transducing protein [Myroides sp. DW712]|uniref:putative signal transducing protein n=1 Tax=Myroides sp. DW712 TaxID=3389800 RepID=UPI00397893AD